MFLSQVFAICMVLLRNNFAIELSCSDVIRTRIETEEVINDLSFHAELKNEACTLRWHIWGYSYPIALQCYTKLPQDDGTCSKFVSFVISDNRYGEYVPCGELNFTVRPNKRELFVALETRDGYTGGGYVDCFILLDPQKESQPLPIQFVYFNHPYYKTSNISKESNRADFKWPPRKYRDSGFWSVFGAPNCTVGIQCNINLNGDLNESKAYVKVSDGTAGEEIFRGNLSFKVKPSDSKLRDMFVKINAPKDADEIQVNCEALCATEDDFLPLPKSIERKTDMRCVCGLHNKDDRIIGGENAAVNEFPWQVALVRKNSRIEFCGGTVINDRFVLTAKHCLQSYEEFPVVADVLIHAHYLSHKTPPGIPEFEVFEDYDEMFYFPIHVSVVEEDKLEKTQRIKIAEVIVPELQPIYIRSDYDIALLRLERKIDLGQPDGPTPVCLPPPNEHATFTDKLVGKILSVTGWGYTKTGKQANELKKANVPYVIDDECDRDLREKMEVNETKLSPRMMCAYIQNQTSINDGMCVGDSGGPLFFQNELHQAVQVGVNSFIARDCPANGTIGVYAKLSEMVQWIEFHTNEWNAKWCQTLGEM